VVEESTEKTKTCGHRSKKKKKDPGQRGAIGTEEKE
jgi:hypothetical protein